MVATMKVFSISPFSTCPSLLTTTWIYGQTKEIIAVEILKAKEQKENELLLRYRGGKTSNNNTEQKNNTKRH